MTPAVPGESASQVPGHEDRPVVIVPAHDEEGTIVKCLHRLTRDALVDEFEVVVVANGCTDATAEVARHAASGLPCPVSVLTTPIASKAAAIRLAETTIRGFPRVYLDADVECSTAAVRALVAAVQAGAPVAVPSRVLDLTASSAPAAAYYKGWQALPWVRAQRSGRGAYALDRTTRRSFGAFPDDIADDRFVTTRVPTHDVVVVDDPVVVRPAGTLREVLQVRRRVYAGNLRSQAPTHDVSRLGRMRGLASTALRQPSLVSPLIVFAATTALAKFLAAMTPSDRPVSWDGTARPVRPRGVKAPPPAGEGAAGKDEDRTAVDAIVVTYRSAGYVGDCIRALDNSLTGVPGARIVVVDNGSGDDLGSVVAGLSDRLELLLRDVNDGFARGCHVGAECSTARRLLFVNPDAVVESETVSALLRCSAQFPEAGIIGGRAQTQDGAVDARSWFGRPTLWSAFCFATGLSSAFPGHRFLDPESSDGWDGSAREVGVVSGGLMLVDRTLWDALDGFDRSFFLYGEDADLCLRARAAGSAVRVAPDAVYQHSVGASSAGSNRLPLVMRGRVTTYRKNLPGVRGRLASVLLVLGTGLRALTAGLRPPHQRPASGRQAWLETWRARAEWRRGWRPGDIPS